MAQNVPVEVPPLQAPAEVLGNIKYFHYHIMVYVALIFSLIAMKLWDSLISFKTEVKMPYTDEEHHNLSVMYTSQIVITSLSASFILGSLSYSYGVADTFQARREAAGLIVLLCYMMLCFHFFSKL